MGWDIGKLHNLIHAFELFTPTPAVRTTPSSFLSRYSASRSRSTTTKSSSQTSLILQPKNGRPKFQDICEIKTLLHDALDSLTNLSEILNAASPEAPRQNILDNIKAASVSINKIDNSHLMQEILSTRLSQAAENYARIA